MVKKSELEKLQYMLNRSEELIKDLQSDSAIQSNWSRERITGLENRLTEAYEEQQRLFTVISSLGKTIQNLERINRNRNRNSNLLQAENRHETIRNP